MTVGFDNTRLWQSSIYNTLNPTLTPSFNFQLRQHLLQGFGFDPNLRYIRIARNNKLITEITFRDQIITTVSQIENIYWDLVNAYENVTVQQRALDLANKTLSDNQKQVNAGNAGAAHRSAVAKRGGHRQAKPDCRPGRSSAGTVADEERHHPQHGRSDPGRRAGDSHRHAQHHAGIRESVRWTN